MEYYGKNGKYSLASQPMKQGGEGAIYAINGRSDLVAKIYFKERVTAELAEKLAFMSNNPPDASILSQIAWPQDVLREQNGDFVGFVMPKLKIDSDLKEIYVYPPKKDLQITYDQKIIIAINICVVISAIHKAGYTFGDFNPLNIGVNLSTGHVAFLDTDSYHIYDKYNRKMYRCGVCLDGYVAPELIQQCKGTDYLSAPLPTFTQETDKFALAIHIFKLLMNGFTPFNGIKETDSVSQASPGRGNQAIEKDNYCFKAGNKPQSVATPDLSAFPPDIQYLFKRAFIDGRENPEYRPSADEWYKALLDYKKNLVQCKRDVNHFYYVNDRECPYCAAEDRYNASLGRPSSSSQMTFSQPISVPGTSVSNAGNYRPTSASSPRVSGSSNSSYVGASGYQTSSTHKKKGNFTKKLIGWVITLGIIGALFGFVVWPKMIYPNMASEDLYTPEIIQVYSGSYGTGRTEGNAVVTITSCDQSGDLTGFFEFIVGNTYGKYEITGKITEKKNNGNLVLSLTPGQWVIQPDDYTPLEMMIVEITDGYQSFECSQYSMYWAVGENDEYSIKTVDDLQKLAGSEATYQLKNDIDLSGVNWKPIEGFKGTLIGNGFTIKNMTIETSASNVGFFSTLNGNVTNLNFENASVTVSGSNENIGVLCGSMQGTASNITVSGTVKADNSKNVGGIIGYYSKGGNSSMIRLIGSVNVSGDSCVGGVIGSCNVSSRNYSNYTVTIESLENSGTVKASSDYAGGLFGFLSYDEGNSYTVTMSGLKNTGDISGKLYVGGLIGCGSTDNNSSYIKNSSSSATITAEAYAGCIAGKLGSIRIDSCSNEGSTLTATKYVTDAGEKYAYVGGYVGRGYLISNCTNAVEINYTSDGKYIGGIMGYTDAAGSTEMQNLKNTANISGSGYVGGIIGAQSVSTRNYSNYTVSLEEFENSGKIVGSSDYVGGIYGYMGFDEGNSYTVYISEFKNTGDVSGKTYVGGLLGYGVTDNNASYIKDSANQSIIKAEAYVGCIAGRLSAIKLDSCTNDGSTLEATKYITDSGEKYAFVGGFVGRGYLASNCSNAVIIDYRSDGKYVGGIMGYTDAAGSTEMENLKNSAAISGKEYVGGIVGCWAVSTRNYSNYTVTLDEFENIGKISGTSNYVGGVFGYMSFDEGNSYTVYMTEFKNEGDVSGKNYVGGLIGYGATDNNSSYIKDSSSSSAITAEAYVGCIAGRLVAVAIDNCTNDGSSISATKYITESDTKFAYLGGFVGRGYLVSNCTNKVNINYSSDGRYVGGIMGYTDASGSTSMSNLKNEVSIKGKDYVGGIIGSWNVSTRNYSNYTVNVDSFDNTGSVTGTGDYVGGLFGHMYFNEGNSYTVFMTELHNSANISGNAYVGGLIGYGETDSDKSSLVDSASTGTVNGTSNYDKVAGKLVKISA